MNEATRLATKAQANGVREYMRSIGVELSHTQALEVIARGAGLRSRHLLSAWNEASVQLAPTATSAAIPSEKVEAQGHRTELTYQFTDGSNCKRCSSMVFRGRLKPEQLRFIVSCLDENEFFVPAQVGFESLHFAFTDFASVDHAWHGLRVTKEQDWALDAEGYVLAAGAVRQLGFGEPGQPTDADTDNLVFRFGRLTGWKPELQQQCLEGWAPKEIDERLAEHEAQRNAAWIVKLMLHRSQELRESAYDDEVLELVVKAILAKGFVYHPTHSEFRKSILPNAYAFVLFEPGLPGDCMFKLNFDVCSNGGTYLTQSSLILVQEGTVSGSIGNLMQELDSLCRAVRSEPAAWTAAFE